MSSLIGELNFISAIQKLSVVCFFVFIHINIRTNKQATDTSRLALTITKIGPAGSGNTNGDTSMSLPDVQIPSSDQVQQNTQGGQNELDLTVTSGKMHLIYDIPAKIKSSHLPNYNLKHYPAVYFIICLFRFI